MKRGWKETQRVSKSAKILADFLREILTVLAISES